MDDFGYFYFQLRRKPQASKPCPAKTWVWKQMAAQEIIHTIKEDKNKYNNSNTQCSAPKWQ